MGFLNDAFGGGIGANVQFNTKAYAAVEALLTADPQIPVSQAKMDLQIARSCMRHLHKPGKNIQHHRRPGDRRIIPDGDQI